MEALVNDWRAKWHDCTYGGTNSSFPFGWVQLDASGMAPSKIYTEDGAANNTPSHGDPVGEWHTGFSGVRAAQTATLLAVANTFQAVSLDTPAINGWVHSPFKQPVGARLARGALSVAYGVPGLTAPLTATATVPTAEGQLTVTIHGAEAQPVHLEVRSALGFEVLGGDQVWRWAPILHTDATAAAVVLGNASGASAVRYLWYMAPCTQTPYRCPIYAMVKALPGRLSGEKDFVPLGPFIQNLSFS